MRRELQGLRVVVTGASRGIGRLTAERLSAAGCRLVLVARSAGPLEELAGTLPTAIACPVDLTTEAGRQEVVRTAIEQFGGLDVLMNIAGVASWGHFATSTADILRTVTEINFFAPAELIRLCLPLLAEGTTPAVLNVASLCGKRGLPAWPEHSGAKAALVGLTEALRGEFARFGVDVLLVVPGLTRSHDLGKHLLRKEGKAALDFENATPPEDVADAIVSALRNGRRETLVGRDTKRLVLANRLAPRFVTWMIGRRIRQLYR